MRIAIVGSRQLGDKKLVFEETAKVLDNLGIDIKASRVTIVSGGAQGVDTLAKEFAAAFKLDHIEFEPYFVVDTDAEYSPRHFFVRNTQIVNNCDVLIAFAFGESKGTRHTYNYAEKKGIPCYLLEISADDGQEPHKSDSGREDDQTDTDHADGGDGSVEDAGS